MILQYRVLLLSAGLSISLLPGCTHTGSRSSTEQLAQRDIESAEVERTAGTNGSPYHSTLPGTPDAVAKAKPSQNAELNYPANTPDQDLVPRPLPLTQAAAVPSSPPREDKQPILIPSPEVKSREPIDPALVAALRCYLNKQPAEAVRWLENYDKPSQEALLCLLPLAARLTEVNLSRADPAEVATMVTQLERLTATLRTRAALTIAKMCFCEHSADNFGVFRALPEEYAFPPGKLVQVYVELQNFTSQRQGHVYSIRLASRLEIRDFNEKLVIPALDFPEEKQPELSQTPRHDFHTNYTFRLPRNTPPGLYTLWLRVTDVPTGRTAERSLDFRVAAERGY
jgi:hypothetical protein